MRRNSLWAVLARRACFNRRNLWTAVWLALLSQVAIGETAAKKGDGQPANDRTGLPIRPDDGTAAAAYDVLKTYCASCHQLPAKVGDTGATAAGPMPRNILDLTKLGKDRRFVWPGFADASLLFNSMAGAWMPPDAEPGGTGRAGDQLPTGAEIAAVRAWIESLSAGKRGLRLPRKSTDHDLTVWLHAPVARVGRQLTVFATTKSACYLNIINIEPSGLATVVYPNDFQRANRVMPGQRVQIPPPNAGFKLTFGTLGRETMVAICTTSSKRLAGINYDFDRWRFSVIGSWENFLKASLGRDGLEARQATRDRRSRRSRQSNGRRDRRRSVPHARHDNSSQPMQQFRAAVAIIVKK